MQTTTTRLKIIDSHGLLLYLEKPPTSFRFCSIPKSIVLFRYYDCLPDHEQKDILRFVICNFLLNFSPSVKLSGGFFVGIQLL